MSDSGYPGYPGDQRTITVVAPARFVTIALASAITGFSQGAIRQKIHLGVWIENRHYVRREGRVLIDLRAYEKWAESGNG
jgi:hypothetical protein